MIYDCVTGRLKKLRTVHDAITKISRACDFGLEMTQDKLIEFFSLWDRVAVVELDDTTSNTVLWTYDRSGWFSTSSAYAAKFCGKQVSTTANFTWKSRVSLHCRFFSWLAIKNRYWMSDQLARRGLPQQDKCPLCDQLEKTINHILLRCVFARHALTVVCATLGSPDCAPK